MYRKVMDLQRYSKPCPVSNNQNFRNSTKKKKAGGHGNTLLK